jgi:hypothetical protein
MSRRIAIGACATSGSAAQRRLRRMILAALVSRTLLSIAGQSAFACQCERFSTCNEVAATNLVFIGTVESVEPMFLNRWTDTSQASIRSLNDAFIGAQEHPSAPVANQAIVH